MSLRAAVNSSLLYKLLPWRFFFQYSLHLPVTGFYNKCIFIVVECEMKRQELKAKETIQSQVAPLIHPAEERMEL